MYASKQLDSLAHGCEPVGSLRRHLMEVDNIYITNVSNYEVTSVFDITILHILISRKGLPKYSGRVSVLKNVLVIWVARKMYTIRFRINNFFISCLGLRSRGENVVGRDSKRPVPRLISCHDNRKINLAIIIFNILPIV